jgi:hypothetical protein
MAMKSLNAVQSELLAVAFSTFNEQTYCRVFYLHVATINVDSPDLTREFIGTMVEITHYFAFDSTQTRLL